MYFPNVPFMNMRKHWKMNVLNETNSCNMITSSKMNMLMKLKYSF